MASFKPGDLIKRIKPDTLRVRAPTSVVFLCGGEIHEEYPKPLALRDAFFRISQTAALNYKIIRAEAAEPLTADAGYRDLLSFESDIAQVVGLILLFAESPGSLAELGSFASLETVAPSLLAVLDDYYYDRVSFIRNGPVRYLENRYGEEWVLVLERNHLGIDTDGRLEALDTANFSSSILPAVSKRLDARNIWNKFDHRNNGHVILLLTGLCHEFGALTVSEIRKYLKSFGVEEPRIDNFIYCAKLLGWLDRVRKGNYIYYTSTTDNPSLDYQIDAPPSERDKMRWRADIRAYWQKNESTRARAITEALSKSASCS